MNVSSRSSHESKNGEYECKKINKCRTVCCWMGKHQCLWNVTLEEYKDRNLREKALENLKESFQTSGK